MSGSETRRHVRRFEFGSLVEPVVAGCGTGFERFWLNHALLQRAAFALYEQATWPKENRESRKREYPTPNWPNAPLSPDVPELNPKPKPQQPATKEPHKQIQRTRPPRLEAKEGCGYPECRFEGQRQAFSFHFAPTQGSRPGKFCEQREIPHLARRCLPVHRAPGSPSWCLGRRVGALVEWTRQRAPLPCCKQ